MTGRSALVALVVAVAVLAATATPAGVVAADAGGPAALAREEPSATVAQATDGSNGTAGQRLAAAFGRERAATAGRLRVRAYERAFAAADSDAERARVSARHLRAGERHLVALEEHRAALQDRRDDGELSAGSHRALAAGLWVEADALATLASTIRNRTADLPDGLREEHGVTEADVAALEDGARELRSSTQAPGSGPDPSVYEDVEAFASSFDGSSGGAVADRLGGERVTFLVETADGRVAVSFTVTDDGRIAGLAGGAHEDPTLRIVTDRETLGELADAENPARRLGTAVRDGDVELRGVGPVNRIEWGIVELAAEVA